MRQIISTVVLSALLAGASACEDDSASDGSAGQGGSGAGTGGASAGRGGAGSSGASAAGAGGAGRGGSSGEPRDGDPCDMPCEDGRICEYVQVACIQAPCPPEPTCVDDASACADEGMPCGSEQACCGGLLCCSGVPVPPGEEFCGTVCPKSDRNAKRDFESVEPDDVLAGLMSLPITTWRYRNETAGVSHLGPMAQDFKATFGLGEDDRYIATVDADGVALAAIQALNRRVDQLTAELAALRAAEPSCR